MYIYVEGLMAYITVNKLFELYNNYAFISLLFLLYP